MEITTHGTWTERLLFREAEDWRTSFRAIASGLILSAAFGLALGARYGGLAMLVGAVGVPAGLLAAVMFGGPALYIGVAHAGVPLSARGLASLLASTVCVCGLLLGGLAPAVTLISVSVDADASAAVIGMAGLALAQFLSLSRMLRVTGARVREGTEGDEKTRGGSLRWVMFAFAVFSALLAARVWWLTIPMLGGGAR